MKPLPSQLIEDLVEMTRGYPDCPECSGRGWVEEVCGQDVNVNRCHLCSSRRGEGRPFPPIDCESF